jgi:hypothetical protein
MGSNFEDRKEAVMDMIRRTLAHLAALLLISACLASCNQPAEINVACDVDDLIQAVNTANADPDSTKLVLAANCTYPFTGADNQDGGHGGNALPLITTKITIQGNNAILSRAGSDDFRFFFITGSGNLNLEDLTLENGNVVAVSNDQPWPRGGAIYNENGALTAERTVFQGNQALGGHGGAVYNIGVFYMDDNCEFIGNDAERGGAIYNTGANDTPLTIYNSNLAANTADFGAGLYNVGPETNILIGAVNIDENWAAYDGGAIYMDDGQMRISGAHIGSNQARYQGSPIGRGGAIFKAEGRLEIANTEISFNSANQQGGGIYNGDGLLAIDNCSLHGNYVTYHSSANQAYGSGLGDGGGIYNLGEVEIDSSTFERNRAASDLDSSPDPIGGNGGGVYNNGIVTLTNSTLYHNDAIKGAGIYNSLTLQVLNCTIVQNEAEVAGSGIVNAGGSAVVEFTTFYENANLNSLSVIQQEAGTFTIKNSLLSDNLPDNCLVQGGTFNALGDNLSGDTTCPGFSIHIPGYVLPTGGFGDHGGPTHTVSILWTSSAVNMAICSDSNNDPVTRDQRGVSRPQPSGSTCDLGSFEFETEGGMTSPGGDHDEPSPEPTLPLPSPTPTSTSEPVRPMAFAPQNTTCREGDNAVYSAAGYLLAGESAEVIGRNQEGTWLVINNPDWDGFCWILRSLVETEGDVDDTEVRNPPPLPTPTYTPVPGCLVQTERGGEPVCVAPCPDDASPGTPCTP